MKKRLFISIITGGNGDKDDLGNSRQRGVGKTKALSEIATRGPDKLANRFGQPFNDPIRFVDVGDKL